MIAPDSALSEPCAVWFVIVCICMVCPSKYFLLLCAIFVQPVALATTEIRLARASTQAATALVRAARAAPDTTAQLRARIPAASRARQVTRAPQWAHPCSAAPPATGARVAPVLAPLPCAPRATMVALRPTRRASVRARARRLAAPTAGRAASIQVARPARSGFTAPPWPRRRHSARRGTTATRRARRPRPAPGHVLLGTGVRLGPQTRPRCRAPPAATRVPQAAPQRRAAAPAAPAIIACLGPRVPPPRPAHQGVTGLARGSPMRPAAASARRGTTAARHQHPRRRQGARPGRTVRRPGCRVPRAPAPAPRGSTARLSRSRQLCAAGPARRATGAARGRLMRRRWCVHPARSGLGWG